MKLTERINRLERRLGWRESNELEVKTGCSVLLAVVLISAIVLWLMR